MTILEYSGTVFKQCRLDAEDRLMVAQAQAPGGSEEAQAPGVYMKLVEGVTGRCTWNNEQKVFIHETRRL